MRGTVRCEVGAGGIARITISNTTKLNALSAAMWRELRAHVEGLAGDVRVVVVRGDGGDFAAGGDIEEFT